MSNKQSNMTSKKTAEKIGKTKIYTSGKSKVTTIPKTILDLEFNPDMDNFLEWNYEIKSNRIIYHIEFIKEDKKEKENNTTNKK